MLTFYIDDISSEPRIRPSAVPLSQLGLASLSSTPSLPTRSASVSSAALQKQRYLRAIAEAEAARSAYEEAQAREQQRILALQKEKERQIKIQRQLRLEQLLQAQAQAQSLVAN